MAETYKYYEHGDEDPKARNERVDLVHDGLGKVRFAGSSAELDADYLVAIRRNIEAGRGKFQKTNEIGQVITGGRADLLKWIKGLEKGGRH